MSLPEDALPAGAGISVGLIDDDPVMGGSLVQRLRLEGYRPVWWQSAEDFLQDSRHARCRLLICDVRLPRLCGEQLFQRIRSELAAIPVIFITAHAELDQAVRLLRAGADDYVTKPFDVDELLGKIATLAARGVAPGLPLGDAPRPGLAPGLERLLHGLANARDMATPILIQGPTGAGKDVLARALHDSSVRAALPFVSVDCASLPPDDVEAVLFGQERAGSGARRTLRLGLVEQAGAGTLLLDEISALAPVMQMKLLRFLGTGSYVRAGGATPETSEARVMSTTNADLPALVARGSFRADLYYRLNTIEVVVPPLRERPGDVTALAHHCLAVEAQVIGRRPPALAAGAEAAMLEHDWPGNVRELENRIHRAVVGAPSAAEITAAMIFPEQAMPRPQSGGLVSLAEARDRAERLHIEDAIRRTGGEIARAASLIGISRTTLWEKMRKLGLQ